MLSASPELEITAEAASLEEVELEEETEVVLLASVSANQVANELDAHTAVLLLTDDAEAAKAFISSTVRAWGVLSPAATQEELVSAVKAISEGLVVATPQLMRHLVRPGRAIELTDGEPLAEPLTARETEVLQRMAEGLANKQIALALGISEHTVKFHLSSLYAKLNVSSRTEAVRMGFSLGLITL